MIASSRAARIHRLRTRQSRMAHIALQANQNQLSRLENTQQQLAEMANSLALTPGQTNGVAPRMAQDLRDRLDAALVQLASALEAAQNQVSLQKSRTDTARRKEAQAEKLADQAKARAACVHEEQFLNPSRRGIAKRQTR